MVPFGAACTIATRGSIVDASENIRKANVSSPRAPAVATSPSCTAKNKM